MQENLGLKGAQKAKTSDKNNLVFNIVEQEFMKDAEIGGCSVPIGDYLKADVKNKKYKGQKTIDVMTNFSADKEKPK